ncbi:MAG: ATPase, T2SS/T4P/T4SS family [Thermoproteota archaeon]
MALLGWGFETGTTVQKLGREEEEAIQGRLVELLRQALPPATFLSRTPENRRRLEAEAYRLIGEAAGDAVLTGETERAIIRRVINQVFGLGVLQPYLERDDLEEVAINPDGTLWLSTTTSPGWIRDDSFHASPEELIQAARRLLELVGRTVNEMHPIEDGRIPRSEEMAAGARVNVVLPPISSGRFPTVNIRFWTRELMTLDDLLERRTLNPEIAAFLKEAVAAHTNICVSGGTKTGKTTLLNILCSFISPDERVVTVEDTQELRLTCPNWVAMEGRPPNIEGQGEISMGTLVRNALRQAPTWLIPGEIRDGEAAYQALRAMSTGHYGMTTVHSESAYDTWRMIVNLAQGAGYYSGNKEAAKERFAVAIRLVVHLAVLPGTTRRVITRVCEVEPYLRRGNVSLRDLYVYVPERDTWEKRAEPRYIGRPAWLIEEIQQEE